MENSNFKNISKKEYFHRYGLKNGIFRLAFLKKKFFYVDDNQLTKILYYKKIRKYFHKQMMKKLTPQDHIKSTNYLCEEGSFWFYWDKGIDSAPEVVKFCYNNLKKMYKDKVILLTNDNFGQYITIDDWLISKMSTKGFSKAFFADVLRFSLLYFYGGTWIDSTVYLSSKIPDQIMDSNVFFFQDYLEIEGNSLYADWFIHAKKNNVIIGETLERLLYYWEKHSFVKEYLTVYIITSVVIEKHPDIYIPKYSSVYATLLLDNMELAQDSKQISDILEKSFIHKLTYKLNYDRFDEKSFFAKMIGGNQNEKN